jgi:putative ABC transport system permease protein
MMTELLTRIRFLVFRKKASEVDDELEFHLEESIAAKIAAGILAAEARRQALIEFGGVQAMRERCEQQRPGWWIGTVTQDVRYAWRGILAHRWFSGAIILTLALGIGMNTMIFTLVDAVLHKPVPVPGGERLVSITNRSLVRDDTNVPISYPDFVDYKTQTNSFESLEATVGVMAILSENDVTPQQFLVSRSTSGIFSMVHANAILGRGLLPTDTLAGAPPIIVLGYDLWQERYAGQTSVIGRQVRVDGQPATIVGVMPKGFMYPGNNDAWMPLQANADLAKRDKRQLRAFAILKPGVTIRAANAELDGIAARLAKQYPEDKDLGMTVLTFHQRYNGGPIRMIFLMMLAAVAFVLLIACADVANMMLGRSLSRKREMSIRAALGASRWRVIRQLMIESILLSILGGVAGLGLAAAGVHWFDLAAPKNTVRPYWIDFTMDYTVFGYFAVLCILSGVLFGIAPALRSSKPDLMGVLKESSHTVSRHRSGWLSGGLVIFQFALTLVLLTGAGVFISGLFRALTVNSFVPAGQITTARLLLPPTRYKDADACRRFIDELLPRLRAIPGVSSVGITGYGPGLGAAHQQIEIEHVPISNPAKLPFVSYVPQTPGYFSEIRLPLLRGRDFNEQDGAEHREAAVVTQDAANQLWPGQDPLGKRFRLYDDKKKDGNWITVVGVSADMVQEFQTNQPPPLLFIPYRQLGWNHMALVVESSTDPLQMMRKAVQSLDPELPVSNPLRLTVALDRQIWLLKVFGKIFMSFALIALLMASVGLYAIIAHATSSRTQEIGVRIAMGATMRNILLLIMKRGLWQITAGLVLGVGAAWPIARLITSAPIGVPHTEPIVILLGVSATLAAVGVFACWLPARRAAALDPVKAIRYE